MKQQPDSLSCCYFPTTVYVIDGNQYFLNKLRASLATDFICEFYDDANNALHVLNKKHAEDPLTKSGILGSRKSGQKRSSVIDMQFIQQEIYNPKRFQEISVVIVNESLPGLQGVEFCREIKDSNIKRILLTHNENNAEALEAFHSGLIDKIVFKDTPEWLTVLKQSVAELQWRFFYDLTILNTDFLTDNSINMLTDNLFIEIFYKYFKQHQLVEYYLLDRLGSYLFLNRAAKPSWLVVCDTERMEIAAERAREANAPYSIIKALQDKIKMLYLPIDKAELGSSDEWEKYMYPVKLLAENQHYYAYINNYMVYDIDPRKILSYEKFLHPQEYVSV